MKNVIQIDTGTICNLDCIFCYRKNNVENKNTITDLEQIKAVFSRKSLFSSVILFGNGEFFANPQWKQIFTYCIKETFLSDENASKTVFLNTNATLLDENSSEFIIKILTEYAVNIRFTFSLNAYNQCSYQKISGKNLYNQAYQNTRNFIKKALIWNKNNTEKIRLNVQSIVISENQNELSDFLNYWKQFFESLNINPELIEENYPIQSHYTVSLRQYVEDKKKDREFFENVLNNLKNNFDIKFISKKTDSYFKRKACNQIFSLKLFDKNKRKLCCKDFNNSYSYPAEGFLHDIYNDYYKTVHLTGNFEKINICTVCNDFENVSDDFILNSNLDGKLKEMYFHRLKTGVPFDIYISDNKVVTKDFLKKFNLLSLDKIYSEKIKLNRNNEDFFCAAWKTYIKSDNGEIYSGCDRQQIHIKDWQKFNQNMVDNAEKSVPSDCVYCNRKFSHNHRQDRMRLFGENSFYSYQIINCDFQNKLSNLACFIENNNQKEAQNLLNNNYNFDFISLFLDNYNNFSDSDFIYNVIFNSDSLFLKLKYLKICDKNFEKACKKIQNAKFFLDEAILNKIIEHKLECYILEAFKILFNSDNYSGYDYKSWCKNTVKTLFGYLTSDNLTFFNKIFLEYKKSSSDNYDPFFKTVFYDFFKQNALEINKFKDFFSINYDLLKNSFLFDTLIDNTVFYLNNSKIFIDFNNFEELDFIFEFVSSFQKYQELQTAIQIIEKHILLKIKQEFNKNMEFITTFYNFFNKYSLTLANKSIFHDILNSEFEKQLLKIDIEEIQTEEFLEKIKPVLKTKSAEAVFNNFVKNKLLNYEFNNKSAGQIYDIYIKFRILSFSDENKEILKSVFIKNIINFIESNREISELINNFYNEKIFYNQKILACIDFKLNQFLQNNKFYSYNKIFKAESEFLKFNTWILDKITAYDFEKIDYRFIKLLYVLSFLETDYSDKFNYTIYSFYMKKQNYTQALFFLDNIKNKLSFFSLKNYIKTKYFLYKNS